jgi:hypothetical protein
MKGGLQVGGKPCDNEDKQIGKYIYDSERVDQPEA